MVSKALGARASASPLAFIVLILFLQAPVVGAAALLRGAQSFEAPQSKALSIALVGICAALAYNLSICASAYAPMPRIASLRQTSVAVPRSLGPSF